METVNITLSRDRAQTVIKAVQGESGAQKLVFTLLDSQNKKITFDGTMTAAFYVDKYIHVPVQLQADIDLTTQTVSVVLNSQATAAAGNHVCLLQVFNDNEDFWRGDVILSVTPNPACDIPSRSELQLLTRLMNGAEDTLSYLNSSVAIMQLFFEKFLTGVETDVVVDFNPGVSNIKFAAADGTRWYFIDGITKEFFYSDDLQLFEKGNLPKYHNVEGMAASSNQLCVLRPKEVHISENRGKSFASAAIPDGLTDANAFIGLRSYGRGFIAIANYFAACDSVYIEYSSGQWNIRSIGRYGKTRDIIACGNKLARACSAHLDDGSVAFTGIRIQDSLDGPDTDITIPDAHIPLKIGWDGEGIHIICSDGATFYVDSSNSIRRTGDILEKTFYTNGISDIVSTCGHCLAVIPDSGTVIYAARGGEWKVLKLPRGTDYRTAAAFGGKFLIAGNSQQAVLSPQTVGGAYEKRMEKMCKEFLLIQQEVESRLGMFLHIQSDKEDIPETLEEGHILLVYQDVSAYSEGTEGTA